MKRFFAVTALAAFLLSLTASLPATAAPTEKAAYQSRQLTAYYYSKEEKSTLTCLFRDDLPDIPYINAVDYLNQLYTVTFTCKKNTDGTYTVSDEYGEMIVDTEKDTVHFEDFDTFTSTDVRPYLEDETADYLLDDAEYEAVGEIKALDLALADYGIDLTASDGKVYFPLSFINDLFGSTYHAALYLSGSLYFVDVMEEEPYYDDAALFRSTKRDKKIAEYAYRELCFVMDHFYGCPPRARLADAIREKGFDKAIETFDATTAEAKELLLSEDLVDYCFGLLYLDMYLDDGGHTLLSYGLQLGLSRHPNSAFATAMTESLYDYTGGRLMTIYQYLLDEMEYTNDRTTLEESRESWFSTMEEIKVWDDAGLYVSAKTAVFTFDEFKDAVVDALKWSLDYAAEHGIVNFILDLSLNGGGSTAVNTYITSVLCDYSGSDLLNCLTDTHYRVNDTVDKNLDGVFDERDDDVRYDLQFGVLTTKYTFSAANMLANQLQYLSIPVLGETSGGGTCAVAIRHDPSGYAYAMSDATMFINPDGEDIDMGAEPYCVLTDSASGYTKLYDIDRMNAAIDAYYANRPAPPLPTQSPDAPAATEPDPGFSPTAPRESIAPYLWIIGSASALVCLILFTVILIVYSRRQRNR